MKTKHPVRAAVAAVAAMLLAACGSAADDSNGNRRADAGPPRSGGSASVIQTSEPRRLDPALMSNDLGTNALVGNSLYGQLLRTDAKGGIQYGLAKSLTTSDGGTTWKLQLRDGLKFSDGTPLDAAAVKFNWARLADPQLGSQSGPFAGLVTSMTPTGQTLAFKLALPVSHFEAAIDQAMNWIASPQSLKGSPQAFDGKPIGAGPFVLDSWTRSGQMVLKKNPAYYDAPRPYLDKLVLTANQDSVQRAATVKSGGADAAFANSRSEAEKAGLNVAAPKLGGGLFMVFNSRIAPFNDVRARQAVAEAVDRAAVLKTLTPGGTAEMPKTLYADGSPYNGDTTLPTYDKAAAQKLFDQLAAEGKPVRFTLTSYSTTEGRRTVEAMQSQLNQYKNVKVQVEVLDFSAAVTKTVQKTFQMITTGLYPGAHPGLPLYLGLYGKSPGNLSGVVDPQMDTALLKGLAATDEAGQTKAFQEVGRRFSAVAPGLIYTRYELALGYDNRLHGVQLYGNAAIRTDTLWVSR
ncbi:ABC transporter substrate-binding protein [Streptomyces sp. NPDC090075]|uniref:ABC transporter substrate-binding protein n=1 Tax=Streptomyces sp. NPDC090075 TaxID=3365937 RepID=UPI0038002E29